MGNKQRKAAGPVVKVAPGMPTVGYHRVVLVPGCEAGSNPGRRVQPPRGGGLNEEQNSFTS